MDPVRRHDPEVALALDHRNPPDVMLQDFGQSGAERGADRKLDVERHDVIRHRSRLLPVEVDPPEQVPAVVDHHRPLAVGLSGKGEGVGHGQLRADLSGAVPGLRAQWT